MKSHKTSIPAKTAWSLRMQGGFTLVEIIVTIAVFSLLVGMGLFFSFDTYKGYLFRSEYETVVSLLQQARNKAMNNVDESEHGVHFESDKYILFTGSAYSASDPNNNEFPANGNITLAGATDIVFEQLTGETSEATLTMSDGRAVGYITIEVESNGRITW